MGTKGLALCLLLAACANVAQVPTTKVCVTDKHDVGSRVWITEWSKEGRVAEILGPSRECRNPEMPILAVAKAS
ncbi:MAG TPA: hypothetical protein VL199_11920 [Burkholderiales bacterium]|nr:hypothetical protein [Burkholderiales bacterium]